jgi:hypothetical protein
MKNNINTENYEVYLMDYFDGNLSPSETEELMLFLDRHPEIKEEATGFEEMQLTTEVVFEDKDLLKKSAKTPPLPLSADELTAGAADDSLSAGEKEALRVLLDADGSLAKDIEFYKKLRLQPDTGIAFTGKESLYRLATDAGEELTAENFDDFAVADLEGDLDENTKLGLSAFVKNNPSFEKDLALINKLKLSPDTNVVFSDKNTLKKKTAPVIFMSSRIRAAVSVAAVFILLMLYPALITDHSPANYRKEFRKNLVKEHIAKVEKPEEEKPEKQKIENPAKENNREILDFAAVTSPAGDLSIGIKEPAPSMQIKENFNYASYIFTAEDGYYEIKLEHKTFFEENPTLAKKLVSKVRSFLKISPKELNVPEDKLTLWDLADAGLKGFGALTESDVSLSRK